MKNYLPLFLFTLIVVLSIVLLYSCESNPALLYNHKVNQAEICIDRSDGSDGDICNCLHKYGLEDSVLCK